MLPFKKLPDNTGCAHKSLGIEGPSKTIEDVYVAYCPDCKREVAAQLDKVGKQTGEYFLTKP